MDWKLFAQLGVTVLVALMGGWFGHQLSTRRDLVNERRKLLISYLLEAYRRMEAASNREDPISYRQTLESAIADIQLLGSPAQVHLARQFAHVMAQDSEASVDKLINDLRQSLREELHLPRVQERVLYLRFNEKSSSRFELAREATIRDVGDAKAEAAGNAAPDQRPVLGERAHVGESVAKIILAWQKLERLVRDRLTVHGQDTNRLGANQLLDLALNHNLITEAQHRALRGLNVMRNLAVHSPGQDLEATKVQDFLDLAEAMNVVLQIA